METLGLLTALFGRTTEAVLVVDAQQTIRLANPQAESLFGWEPTELSGQPLSVLIPQHVRDHHERVAHEYQGEPHPREMGAGLRLFALNRAGDPFPVDVALGPIVLDGTQYVACVVRPLTAEPVGALSSEAVTRELNHTALQSMFGVGLSLSASLDDFGTEASRARVERAAADLRQAVEEIRAYLQHGEGDAHNGSR